jgi:hypothetical protein
MNELKSKNWLFRPFGIAFVSFISFVVFCYGCSAYETNHWGQPQGFITQLLAVGAYLSLFSVAIFIILGIISVLVERGN